MPASIWDSPEDGIEKKEWDAPVVGIPFCFQLFTSLVSVSESTLPFEWIASKRPMKSV